MPTCLITGGAGFIGSHLTELFLKEGWTVRVIDNLVTGHRKNLAPFADRITFIEGDVGDDRLLAKAVRGVEVVLHHAAMVSVPQSVADPLGCHERCATATLKVLMAARDAGCRRVVYAASSSAYGGAPEGAIDERTPILALSPYAAGKLAGEHYCSAFAETTNLETVRLRYFNVFGPRQDPTSPYSGVISIFATKLQKGESPTIFGDGHQSRDFIYVANVARANFLAATTPGVSGKVFNIGAGKSITLLELLHTMNSILGTSVAATLAPPRVGDVRHSEANIAAARAHLAYEPLIPFETGMRTTLDYYRCLGS